MGKMIVWLTISEETNAIDAKTRLAAIKLALAGVQGVKVRGEYREEVD